MGLEGEPCWRELVVRLKASANVELRSTLIHVDADARMDSYTDKDGNPRTALNLVQST